MFPGPLQILIIVIVVLLITGGAFLPKLVRAFKQMIENTRDELKGEEKKQDDAEERRPRQ